MLIDRYADGLIDSLIDEAVDQSLGEKLKMPGQTMRQAICSLLQNESLLTPADIAKKLKKDKARVSGYLEAMVDCGEISMKKVGNGKVYFLNKQVR